MHAADGKVGMQGATIHTSEGLLMHIVPRTGLTADDVPAKQEAPARAAAATAA